LCDTDYSTTINGTLYNFENRRGLDILPGAAASGCDSIIDVNLVFVELFYEYEVLSPPCPGDSIGSVEITSWEGTLPAVISWDNIEINLDALPFSFGFPINERFILEIRDEDGCNGSQLINIMEREPIELETISTDLGGNTYELEVISSDEIAEYKWYPELNLSCIDCPNPVITLNDNDQFLYVDIITTGGCLVSDTIYLGFNAEDIVYAPTIFSPNQDGNNDTWTLYASPESDLIFKDTYIYDRWGKLVKILPSEAINNLNLGWDGGEHLPGVYVYRLEYEDRSGQSRILTGDFTLIR
jgi:gliding motility-associated-like protein